MRFPILAALAAGLAAACGSTLKPETFPTPEGLWEASMAAWERGDCGDAQIGFDAVAIRLPPRDPRVGEARYLAAMCELDDGERLEAARRFRRLVSDFPQHERAPWALLREGDAYAELWNRPELDPTYGRSALSSYRELLSLYPNAEPADSARGRMQDLQDLFARKDLKNGEFYLRFGAYDSAIIYFRSVVAQWPESRLAPLALLKLVETYRKIGYTEELEETCAHLRRFYPDTEGVADQCPPEGGPTVSRSP
jgi:outer membrane protein assembly factor BamD